MLKYCEACHVSGFYNFSNSAYTNNDSALMNNLLYNTVAEGTLASGSTTSYQFSPYVELDVDYGAGFSYVASTGTSSTADGTTLVTSPIASACFACHDSNTAETHMKTMGGTIYETRTTAIQP